MQQLSSKYIGVIYEVKTKEIRAVFNPAHDEQLDDSCHIMCPGEERKMLKIPRGEFPSLMTPYYIPKILEIAEEFLKEE